ncbi:MAG: histidine phosphatase family protein [Bacteroidetes bacterium]|nr:histidine phosphatase family protein [Bacteroidota bacterium]MBS1632620.1 histidine phosphatase family protein [Bacteroidota bacterium]
MKYAALLFLVVFISCSHTYYIVRHAEKAPASSEMMSSDMPLSDAGKERASALKELMKNKKIHYVFSTNFIRTRSTVEPTAGYFHLQTEMYGPVPDPGFISKMKSLRKNVLISGHSNTIDDVVNMLCGKTEVPGDLPESEYDNLFIVKKVGKRFVFIREKYGAPSN